MPRGNNVFYNVLCLNETKGKVKAMKKKKYVFGGILIIYLLFVIRIIIFKDIPLTSVFNFMGRTREINIIPFTSIFDFVLAGTATFKQVLTNILGNIVIFIPLGIMVPILFNKKKFVNIVVIGGCISIFFELVQFILAIGVSDIDDVILNICGGVIGWFIYYVIGKLKLSYKVKENLYIVVLMGMGIASFFVLLFTNSEVLINFNKNTETVNQELVQHIDIDRPDFYGEIINYDDDKITVMVNNNIIEFILDDNTTIHKEIYTSESFLGQIVKEYIVFHNISKDEFIKMYQSGSIADKVSLWSDDGKYINDLLIFEWNFN